MPFRTPAEYAEHIRKVKAEQPDLSDVPVEEVGWLGRLSNRFTGATATTDPFTGSVRYDPERMGNLSPDETENVFAHEFAHSRQIRNTPYLSRLTNVMKSMIPGQRESYYDRPEELEAYQAERDRSLANHLSTPDPITGQRDIRLPPLTQKRKIMSMFTNDRQR